MDNGVLPGACVSPVCALTLKIKFEKKWDGWTDIRMAQQRPDKKSKPLVSAIPVAGDTINPQMS